MNVPSLVSLLKANPVPRPARIGIAIAFFVLLLTTPLLADRSLFPWQGPESLFSQDQPIEITSDQLEFNPTDKQGAILFRGKVTVSQKNIRLQSDELSLVCNDAGQIQSMLARGNVRLQHQVWNATAGKLTYESSSQLLVFSDSPAVQNGAQHITGKHIRFFLNSGKIEVDSAAAKIQLPKPMPENNP